MRVKSLLCVFFLLLMAGGVFAQVQTGSAYPKREFRAAWIQSVNGQFRGMPTEKLKQNLAVYVLKLTGSIRKMIADVTHIRRSQIGRAHV